MTEQPATPAASSRTPALAPDDLDRIFDDAMRQVATAGSGTATRAGQVKLRLQQVLGVERAAACRARVHGVVVAAEEHVPATLSSLAPVSEAALTRVAADLAAKRGWTYEAALLATRDWTTALRLSRTGPSSVSPDDRAAEGPAQPVAAGPTAQQAVDAVPPPPVEETAAGVTTWPPTKPQTQLLMVQARLNAEAAAHAYAGWPLPLFWSLISVLMIVAFAGAVLIPGSMPGRPNAIVSGLSIAAAVFLTTRLKRGLLIATAAGLTFVPFDRRMTAPSGEAPTFAAWPAVQVVATGSGGRLATGQIQLGPRRVYVGTEGSRLLRALYGRQP